MKSKFGMICGTLVTNKNQFLELVKEKMGQEAFELAKELTSPSSLFLHIREKIESQLFDIDCASDEIQRLISNFKGMED